MIFSVTLVASVATASLTTKFCLALAYTVNMIYISGVTVHVLVPNRLKQTFGSMQGSTRTSTVGLIGKVKEGSLIFMRKLVCELKDPHLLPKTPVSIHYGFMVKNYSGERQENKTKAVCRYCSGEVRYFSGSMSNMLTHPKRHHSYVKN